MLECHKTTEDEKRIICEWKYDGEYAIYNSIPYEKQVETQRGFANPKNNFYSFCDGATLVGYINLIEKDSEVIFGIGVNPAYCNQGNPSVWKSGLGIYERSGAMNMRDSVLLVNLSGK